MIPATTVLENFTEKEVQRHGPLEPELLVKLQVIRYKTGLPIHITSGLRHGDEGDHGDDDDDGEGEGVDISDNGRGKPISSRWRFEVEKAAYEVGLRRKGSYDRHIHLGISKEADQDVSWIGVSK